MEKKSDAMIKNMKKEIAENHKQIVGLKEENALQKVQIAKMEDNNRAIKRKMGRILFCIPNAEKFLIRSPMPAELLNEVFASLPMENAFDILAKMPNGLLARNMQKMLKSIEMAMRNNKWNEAQCGPKLAISGGGLVVNHSGPNGSNSVLAQSPILKFNLNAHKTSIAYFEVEIIVKDPNWNYIDIGFFTQQFPLEGYWHGYVQNSIGIWHKGGIFIDEKIINFENADGFFKAGEVIGIGIVHLKTNLTIKCFATCNGQLLGKKIIREIPRKVNLPTKFADFQLFPAISICHANNSIRANFGANPFRYNPREILQNF